MPFVSLFIWTWMRRGDSVEMASSHKHSVLSKKRHQRREMCQLTHLIHEDEKRIPGLHAPKFQLLRKSLNLHFCHPRMHVKVPTKALPSGAKIPVIGLGVYKMEPGAETYNAVLSALKLGYRHIDTAQGYQNKADVGRAVRDSGIPREEIFVTSELLINNWGYETALATTKASNEKLGLRYIDLFLLHAPGHPTTRDENWRALEELQEQGILKEIGVSNFGEAHLEKFLKTAKVKPAVNQIELHPWLMRPQVVNYCREHDILLQAYAPIARARKLEDPTVLEIANEVDATAAQVLLAFSLANGFIALPKSSNADRQKINLQAANITLTPTQVARIAELDPDHGVAWDPITTHAV